MSFADVGTAARLNAIAEWGYVTVLPAECRAG